MMILNLINVIAIAMGIGTSTKNTNFKYEKKSHRNEATAETIGINEAITMAPQNYEYSENGTDYKTNKGFIGTTYSPNYYTGYFNISNTIYAIQKKSSNSSTAEYMSIFKINNYYNSDLTFRLDMYFTVEAYGRLDGGYRITSMPNNMDQYINLTLTNSIDETLVEMQYYARDNGTVLVENQNLRYEYTTETTVNMQAGSGEITIQPNETITLYYYMYTINHNNTNWITTEPNSFNIYGVASVPDIHQEIVDIPGLMFTILTLPFSFISQAFNLTIFPGTPYQINFTNLFMTIIAIFILLWLIKHIFK